MLALALLPAYTAASQPDDERPVTVEVSEISPYVEPDGRLVIRGNLLNKGEDAIRDLQLRLRVGQRIETRSELSDIASSPDREANGQATRVELAEDEVGPDKTVPFAVDLPAGDVAGLGAGAGVHPLRIEVRGRTARTLRPVGQADTFLQWWPGGRARSRIAWVWPLAQADDRDVDGVYGDDSLAESIAPGGRLAELLQVADGLASETPVTWAVDPALIAAVADMADGYRVATSGEPEEGRGDEAATSWLAAARAAMSKRQSPVLALPYADPDVVALVRAEQADRVGTALREGRAVLRQRLGVNADPALAWPPDGMVDSATVDVLESDGVRTVVLAEDTVGFPPEPPLNYTRTAAAPLDDEGTTALVVDETLDAIVKAGADGAGDRLDVQRFLAETALITLERPSLPRDIVVAPPRSWTPLRAYARDLLEQSATVPWLEPSTLPAVAERADSDGLFVTYPESAVAAELPQEFLARVSDERERLAQFRSILQRETQHTLPVLGAETLDRAVSASRRSDLGGASLLVDSVSRRLDREFGRVRIITGGVVTMTSDTGGIPLTIENGLNETVLLRVVIASKRLQLDDPRPVEQAFGEGKTQLTITGRALQAGDFTIEVQLRTPDGDPLPGGTATLRVRSTAYGKVALVITIGAFGVLLVASATRLIRRRRRSAPAPA